MSRALSYLVAARRSEVNELENLTRTCELVLAVNELVHCLQQERGASNIFLASAGARFAEVRQERIVASDAALATVSAWLDQAEYRNNLSGGARLLTRIAIALHALDGLAAIRADIGKLSSTPAAATGQYNRLVGSLLALVFESADVAVDPTVSRLLIALFHLMQGKEFAGQERATGAAAFAQGKITDTQACSIEYLIEMQEQSLQRFEAFADDLIAEWHALQATLPLSQLERLRRVLLTAKERSLDCKQTEPWFECCSKRMDELHHIETHLAGQLQMICRNKVAERLRELEDQKKLFETLAGSEVLPPLAAFTVQINPATDGGNVGPHLTQAVVDMLKEQSLRLQTLTEELATVRASLDERKVIERAKGILMARQGLNEEDAYRLLRQNAMNQNRRLADIAQAVMSLAEILPGAGR